MVDFRRRVGIGFLVTLPITFIVTGGVENGFFLLAVSIICTAGISLVVWIPLWWIVGWLTLWLVGLIKTRDGKPAAAVDRRERTSQTYRALLAYIRSATESGMEVDEMKRRLRAHGWLTADIERAHQDFINATSKSAET